MAMIDGGTFLTVSTTFLTFFFNGLHVSAKINHHQPQILHTCTHARTQTYLGTVGITRPTARPFCKDVLWYQKEEIGRLHASPVFTLDALWIRG
jgi:hypothetical protein